MYSFGYSFRPPDITWETHRRNSTGFAVLILALFNYMTLLYIIIPLFIIYSLLIIYYWLIWKSIPAYTATISSPQTSISVIIAARNEEDNIGHLLEALQKQTYPAELFEVLVVDDHSTDRTADIVQRFLPLIFFRWKKIISILIRRKPLKRVLRPQQVKWL